MSKLTRIATVAAVVFFAVAAVVVVVFALGKPMSPQASAVTASAASTSAAEGASPAAGGPNAGESDPLAIQIPGCVCHSDDPKVVEEHAAYRMSQCFDCHKDGVPEMGQ